MFIQNWMEGGSKGPSGVYHVRDKRRVLNIIYGRIARAWLIDDWHLFDWNIIILFYRDNCKLLMKFSSTTPQVVVSNQNEDTHRRQRPFKQQDFNTVYQYSKLNKTGAHINYSVLEGKQKCYPFLILKKFNFIKGEDEIENL